MIDHSTVDLQAHMPIRLFSERRPGQFLMTGSIAKVPANTQISTLDSSRRVRII